MKNSIGKITRNRCKRLVTVVLTLALFITSFPVNTIKAETINEDYIGELITTSMTDNYDKVNDIPIYYQIIAPAGDSVGKVKTVSSYELSMIGLTSISIPESILYNGKKYIVTEIGSDSFCFSTFKEIKLPNTIDTICTCAFQSSGIENIIIPDSVITIESKAFQSCSNLKAIKLSTNLITISENSFLNCGLESVYIPPNVQQLYGAFQFCNNLKDITVAEDNPYYKSTSGLLLSKDGKELITTTSKSIISVPEGVEKIDFIAFKNCYTSNTNISTISNLLKLTLPSTLKNCDFSNSPSIQLVVFKGNKPPKMSGNLPARSGILVNKSSCSKYMKTILKNKNIITTIPYLKKNKTFLKKMLTKNGTLSKKMKAKGLKKPKDVSTKNYQKIKNYAINITSEIPDSKQKSNTLFWDILTKKVYNYDAWYSIAGSFYTSYKKNYNVNKYNSTYTAFKNQYLVGEGFSNLVTAYNRCINIPCYTVTSSPGKYSYDVKNLNIAYINNKMCILDASDTSVYCMENGEILGTITNVESMFDVNLEIFSINNVLQKVIG